MTKRDKLKTALEHAIKHQTEKAGITRVITVVDIKDNVADPHVGDESAGFNIKLRSVRAEADENPDNPGECFIGYFVPLDHTEPENNLPFIARRAVARIIQRGRAEDMA